MKLLFLGAGAIGTHIGGSLAAAGHSVSYTERPEVAEALSHRGLTLHLARSTRHVHTARFFGSSQQALQGGPYDVVVFALKSFNTSAAAQALVETGLPVPPALSLQNGVDNEPAIAAALGDEGLVIAGTVTTAVGTPGLGEVVEQKHRGVGIASGHPLSQPLVEALHGAGLNARSFPNAAAMKWSKLLTNLTGNATSAILDMRVDELFADRRLYQVEVAVLRECLAVMRALGHHPVDLPGTPVRLLALAAERLPRFIAQPALTKALGSGRGDKMPSFHIDLHSGSGRTEVQWLNGAVARHGTRVGVATPVNTALTQTLEGLAAGKLDIELFRRNPEALLAQF